MNFIGLHNFKPVFWKLPVLFSLANYQVQVSIDLPKTKSFEFPDIYMINNLSKFIIYYYMIIWIKQSMVDC